MVIAMLQEKLELLLNKYQVASDAKISADGRSVRIGGEVYPLLSHRFERRFVELRRMLHDGTVSGVSAIRCGNVGTSEKSLDELILRELDICRFLSGREIVSIAAFGREGRAENLIAVLDNDVVCSIEVANTLPAGAQTIDKHEVISARGLVCDRVVDTQIPQNSIYLYADENIAYTDVDFELYGLDADKAASVRAAFALAKDESLRQSALCDMETLRNLLSCAAKSAADGRKVTI